MGSALAQRKIDDGNSSMSTSGSSGLGAYIVLVGKLMCAVGCDAAMGSNPAADGCSESGADVSGSTACTEGV